MYSAALATNTATYSVQDGHVGVQMSAWYGSVLPVDLLHANLITRRSVGVIYALLHPDNSLFHARRLTTVTAVSLLVVRPCGTVYQLHFDWTCHCISYMAENILMT